MKGGKYTAIVILHGILGTFFSSLCKLLTINTNIFWIWIFFSFHSEVWLIKLLLDCGIIGPYSSLSTAQVLFLLLVKRMTLCLKNVQGSERKTSHLILIINQDIKEYKIRDGVQILKNTSICRMQIKSDFSWIISVSSHAHSYFGTSVPTLRSFLKYCFL